MWRQTTNFSPELVACLLHGSGYSETSPWGCPLASISDADDSLTLWLQLSLQPMNWTLIYLMVLDGSMMAKEFLWRLLNSCSFKTFMCKAVGPQLLFELIDQSIYLNLSGFQSLEILHWIRAKIRLPIVLFSCNVPS